MKRRITALAAVIAVCAAQAQVALPPVQTPRLPEVRLPIDVNQTLSGITQNLDPDELIDLRRLRVRTMLREHRALIEADPRGAPILRAEVVAFSPSPQALERAKDAGFSIVREQSLEDLDARIVVLRAPERMSTKQALKKLRTLDEQGAYDFNHLYFDGGIVSTAVPNLESQQSSPPRKSVPQMEETSEGAGLATKIGLIDGGLTPEHPAFADKTLHIHGCNGKPVASAHGNAVASLLIGHTEKIQGVAPYAELYAVDVYCGQPTGGAVDAIAAAFSWLSREQVGVINVSLVGPANVMLENVIRLVTARGHLVVAAVGNDGPNAPPLYPAAYPAVIGVTGVDSKRRVLLEALRGKQVDFAAQGADLAAADATNSFVAVRGTSFAAPIVAGLLAAKLSAPDKAAAEGVVQQLAAQAVDLGAKGPDPVYGQGFLAPSAHLSSINN